MDALLAVAVIALAAALFATHLRIRRLDFALRWQDVQISALCKRVGVSDHDVAEHHARIHPGCDETVVS